MHVQACLSPQLNQPRAWMVQLGWLKYHMVVMNGPSSSEMTTLWEEKWYNPVGKWYTGTVAAVRYGGGSCLPITHASHAVSEVGSNLF